MNEVSCEKREHRAPNRKIDRDKPPTRIQEEPLPTPVQERHKCPFPEVLHKINWDFNAWANKEPNFKTPAMVYFTLVASSMFPMEASLIFNPLKTSQILECVRNDDAMFHAKLCTAVSFNLMEGVTKPDEAHFQMSRTLSLVNERLRISILDLSEGTISAVSCLATADIRRAFSLP